MQASNSLLRGRRADSAALTLLLLTAIVVTARMAGDVGAFIRGDWPTAFLPWYSELGRRLRAFDIPGWNPYQFSGTPFIGDPSSGWMYLPVMAAYTLLPPLAATVALIAFHIMLSAISAYVLARLTGLGPAGALVAGFIFSFPWLLPASAGMVLMVQMTTWLPVALIGVELARRPGRELRRFGGLVLGGLALSQILAAWLGQGSYYALLVIGGWVAWRTLVTPPVGWSMPARLLGLLGIGGGILLIGFALNAAALLVRLDANSRSNAAGGIYSGISGWADTKGGSTLAQITRALAGGYSEANWQYIGIGAIALALLAPMLATRWPPLLFWILVSAAAILMTLPERNVVQAVAYALLPRFEMLHAHLPDRILQFLPLPVAMLAGATVDGLSRGLGAPTSARDPEGTRPTAMGEEGVTSVYAPSWSLASTSTLPSPGSTAGYPRSGSRLGVRESVGRPAVRAGVLLLGALLIAAGMVALQRQGIISRDALLVAVATLAVALVGVALPANVRPVLLPLAVAAIIVWDPAGRVLAVGWEPGGGAQRSLSGAFTSDSELDAFLFQNGAARFLLEAARAAPGRYAGYDPAYLPDVEAAEPLPPQAYRNHWLSPANWLLVQNWGTWFGVEDVQGYNPISIRRYGEYIDALNGHRQEYHETDIFPSGLTSPLVDPLNVRFLIVPADAASWEDFDLLLAALPTVYSDGHVRVLEHPGALPRAWLVHEAQQVSAAEILPLLASNAVDPAEIALLEAAPPLLDVAPNAATEMATYVRRDPDRFTVEVEAVAPALLSLSEIWDPGWQATVDGTPAQIYQVNFIFQGIAIPAGRHLVDVRYSPPYLGLGIGISGGTVILLSLVAAMLYRREWSGTTARHAQPSAVSRQDASVRG